MGKSETSLFVLAAIIVLAIFAMKPAALFGEQGAVPIDTSVSAVSCGDVVSAGIWTKAEDKAATTLTYGASSTIYLQDATNGVLEDSVSSSSSAYAENTARCGTKYNLFAVTQTGVFGATATKAITAGKTAQYHELAMYALDPFKFRVKDVSTDSYFYIFNNGATTGTNATTYTSNLNASNIYSDTAATAETIGTDGKLEKIILVRATSANQYATDPTLKWWICADGGTTSEYQQPVISFDGVKLTENKAGIDADSSTGSLVSASEWCFPVAAPVDDAEHTINLLMQARSGVNPSNDPVVSLLSEGTYVSSKVPNKIKTGGIYTDAATQALVAHGSAYVPSITFVVA